MGWRLHPRICRKSRPSDLMFHGRGVVEVSDRTTWGRVALQRLFQSITSIYRLVDPEGTETRASAVVRKRTSSTPAYGFKFQPRLMMSFFSGV